MTNNEIISNSSKKVYLVKKGSIKKSLTYDSASFFKLTSNNYYSHLDSQSQYGFKGLNTLQSENPEQISHQYSQILNSQSYILPKIHPSYKLINTDQHQITKTYSIEGSERMQALNKIAKGIHKQAPIYIKLKETLPKRNIELYQKYQRGWQNKIKQRKKHSLINRSLQKSKQYLEKYNIEMKKKLFQIRLDDQLRGRDKKYQLKALQNIKGQYYQAIQKVKGKKGITGLNNKSSNSLFERVFTVEEVYKSNKNNSLIN